MHSCTASALAARAFGAQDDLVSLEDGDTLITPFDRLRAPRTAVLGHVVELRRGEEVAVGITRPRQMDYDRLGRLWQLFLVNTHRTILGMRRRAGLVRPVPKALLLVASERDTARVRSRNRGWLLSLEHLDLAVDGRVLRLLDLVDLERVERVLVRLREAITLLRMYPHLGDWRLVGVVADHRHRTIYHLPLGRPEHRAAILGPAAPHRTLVVADEVEGLVFRVMPDQRPRTLKKGDRLVDAEALDHGKDRHRVHLELLAELVFQLLGAGRIERPVVSTCDPTELVGMRVDGVLRTTGSRSVVTEKHRGLVAVARFLEADPIEQIDGMRTVLGHLDIHPIGADSRETSPVFATKKIE